MQVLGLFLGTLFVFFVPNASIRSNFNYTKSNKQYIRNSVISQLPTVGLGKYVV